MSALAHAEKYPGHNVVLSYRAFGADVDTLASVGQINPKPDYNANPTF